MSADLVIAHLYPSLLRTYGDRGNVETLELRATWRGFSVKVVGVEREEPLGRASLVFIGGGADRAQATVAEDFRRRGDELRDAVAGGTVLFGVCAGYQLLGHSYLPESGRQLRGVGLIDAKTVAGRGRMVGNVKARAWFAGKRLRLQGFENHSGRTILGEGAMALATVPRGCGNNGEDRTEGAVQGNVVGTYLHGPVLPRNPEFADLLLDCALDGRLEPSQWFGPAALAPTKRKTS